MEPLDAESSSGTDSPEMDLRQRVLRRNNVKSSTAAQGQQPVASAAPSDSGPEDSPRLSLAERIRRRQQQAANNRDDRHHSARQCFGSGSALDPHSMAARIRVQEAIKELK
jgi:K+-transporting ATPase c subunit